MARASDDVVLRIVCANTVPENEKKLLEARIKHQVLRHKAVRDDDPVEGSICTAMFVSMYCYLPMLIFQGKDQAKQDLTRLFTKLNQAKASVLRALEQSSPSCYNRRVRVLLSVGSFSLDYSWWCYSLAC